MRRTEIEREEDCARNDSRRETQGKRERERERERERQREGENEKRKATRLLRLIP